MLIDLFLHKKQRIGCKKKNVCETKLVVNFFSKFILRVYTHHKLDLTSSQVFHCSDAPRDHTDKDVDRVAESRCIKGVDHDQNEEDRQLKRTRIRETIGLLRRVIPGGHGKDAVTVLDEAICYLKSLKLKARSLNSSH